MPASVQQRSVTCAPFECVFFFCFLNGFFLIMGGKISVACERLLHLLQDLQEVHSKDI